MTSSLVGLPVPVVSVITLIIAETGTPLSNLTEIYTPVRYKDGTYDVLREDRDGSPASWARSPDTHEKVREAVTRAATMPQVELPKSGGSVEMHFRDKDGISRMARVHIGYGSLHFDDELFELTEEQLSTAT